MLTHYTSCHHQLRRLSVLSSSETEPAKTPCHLHLAIRVSHGPHESQHWLWGRKKWKLFSAISQQFPANRVKSHIFQRYLHLGVIKSIEYISSFIFRFAVSQKRIGFVDVKSSSVYFYVQRSDRFYTTGIIPFEIERLNIGGAMNLKSGKFTVPRNGTYAFSFTGLAGFSSSSSIVHLFVEMRSNGGLIGKAGADKS